MDEAADIINKLAFRGANCTRDLGHDVTRAGCPVQALQTFEATYYNSYVAHAPIEPHTAVAEVKEGRLTVWSSTQAPFSQQRAIAAATGFGLEDVRVITPYVGGGFGGKVPGLQAVEAARLATITGKPVQVAWTRAEEFFYDTFRPAAVIKVTSGIDAGGKIRLWDYQVYGAGTRGSDVIYDVPNHSVRVYGEWGRAPAGMHPFAVGAWRAPGANSNRFAAEQQIDFMAAAVGMDPLEFRLHNTTDPRMLATLNTVADAYGWEPSVAPRGNGRGRGLACGMDAETYVALIAEVIVDFETGVVKVDRIVCAQDMGSWSTRMAHGCRWRGASPWDWATCSVRRSASAAERSWIRTSEPTVWPASHGCRSESTRRSSPTAAYRPRAAASPRSSTWGPWSPTRSSTPPACGSTGCR